MSRTLPRFPQLRVVGAAVILVVVAASAYPAAADSNAVRQLMDARDEHHQRHGGAGVSWPAGALPGRLLITTDGTSTAWEQVRSSLPRNAGAGRYQLSSVADDSLILEVPPGDETRIAHVLATLPGVVAVEPDRVRSFAASPNDPGFAAQWSHRLTGAVDAWNTAVGSPAVRVAVIDSGIRGDHEDLRANIVEQVDASSGRLLPAGMGVDNDTCGLGHGTQVAGVLAAVGNNGVGISGMAWRVSVIDLAVVSQAAGTCQVGPPDSAILTAMYYAVSHPDGPVDVINLSLGAPEEGCPVAYQRAIAAARRAGIVVVAAAGNSLGDPAERGVPSVPASCDGVLSVGAVGRHLQHATYSRSNAWVDLSAPGGDAPQGCPTTPEECLLTTAHHGGYTAVQGTSYAAPQVAGAVALLRAASPGLTPEDVESALVHTAIDLGPSGHDAGHGWGMVRIREALRFASSAQPPFAPVLDVPFPPSQPTLTRVWAGDTPTDAVTGAVALSQELFDDGGARHGVLVAASHPLEALAASALGLGLGPVLFATADGIPAATLSELGRVLRPGTRVYVVGGEEALPAGIETELHAMGLQPRRVAGDDAAAVAAEVSQEVPRLAKSLGLRPVRWAVLAGSDGWVDAAAAAGLAATFGVPILLTPTAELHPEARAALSRQRPEVLLIVGGQSSLSTETAAAAAAAAGDPAVLRLAGDTRNDTVLAVNRAMVTLLAEEAGRAPGVAILANVRREDAWAHLLSASALMAARTGVLIPIEADGNVLASTTVGFVTGLGVDVVAVGGPDLVAGDVAQTVQGLSGRQ